MRPAFYLIVYLAVRKALSEVQAYLFQERRTCIDNIRVGKLVPIQIHNLLAQMAGMVFNPTTTRKHVKKIFNYQQLHCADQNSKVNHCFTSLDFVQRQIASSQQL